MLGALGHHGLCDFVGVFSQGRLILYRNIVTRKHSVKSRYREVIQQVAVVACSVSHLNRRHCINRSAEHLNQRVELDRRCNDTFGVVAESLSATVGDVLHLQRLPVALAITTLEAASLKELSERWDFVVAQLAFDVSHFASPIWSITKQSRVSRLCRWSWR